MNEQQQYEKHLAEKFQQLPLPDVEPNWQQMKLRLDKEMPRGGGYWRWITGFGILLFMLGGTWFFISRTDTEGVAGLEMKKQKEPIEQGSPSNSSLAGSSEKELRENPPGKNSGNQLKDLKTTTIDENLPTTTDNKSSEVSDLTKAEQKQVTKDNPNRGQQNQNNNLHPKRNKSSDATLRADEFILPGKRIVSGRKSPDKPGTFNNQASGNSPYSIGEQPVKNSTVRYSPQNFISVYTVDKLAGDAIKDSYSGIFPKSASKSDQTSGKLSGKTKSAKPSALESVQNRTIAVGLSLPMGFPLGDQKPGAYNMNAKPNTVSDFLPVPHMQYHINNKVYLQTELQLINPQYIQPVLLYQTRTAYPSTNTIHNSSIYAKKLYYFNIPVGIHYSPLPHFYLGTGLQFSSFVSGVALQEETNFVVGSATTNVLSQRYTKFRNDTLSNRIDNSEFRLMLDANYYWKQFTVGLRYNQALSNYVSFRLNNASPLFQDKNKSLQFYLRYNLWEDYKRRKK